VKVVYLPVYRVAASYTVSFGRRWSVLEHLLLVELSRGRRKLGELAASANLPERLIVEALINLLRANWIEIQSNEAVTFQTTAAGNRWASEESLPPQIQRSVKWISLCVDRLTGAWLRADDLDLVYEKDLPTSANILEPRLHTYSASDGRLRELLYLEPDEVLEPEEPQFRTPSRPFARVVISFDQIEQGLTEAPLELRDAVLQAAAGIPEMEKTAPEPPPIENQKALYDTITSADIIVGGLEHRALLSSVLAQSRSHVVLHSCFLDAAVVKSLFEEFEMAARRGVRVDLLWGLAFDAEGSKSANAVAQVQAVLAELSPHAKSLVQLSPISSGSHAKLLLHDTLDGNWRSYVGSCNYLSSWFNAIDISIALRNQKLAAGILAKLLASQLPASGSWSPLARRLSRVWNDVRARAASQPVTGEHRVSLLEDGDHYALIRVARDRSAQKIVVGCDLYGLAAETSVMAPMQRAAERGRKVSIYYQRPSKLLKETGRIPDPIAARERGLALDVCQGLHGKFVTWDDEDMAITSFNWLATVVDGVRNRGAELGVWISGPNITSMLADKLSRASGGKLQLP